MSKEIIQRLRKKGVKIEEIPEPRDVVLCRRLFFLFKRLPDYMYPNLEICGKAGLTEFWKPIISTVKEIEKELNDGP